MSRPEHTSPQGLARPGLARDEEALFGFLHQAQRMEERLVEIEFGHGRGGTQCSARSLLPR